MRTPDNRWRAPRAGVAAAALLAACGGSAPRVATAPPPPPPPAASSAPIAAAVPAEDDAGIPVSPTDPTWGRRTALVTIVEFADFQCPYCAHAEPALARVRETYGPDSVRIVWKNSPLPFHEDARPAAEAGAGVHALAGDDAFWRFSAAAYGALGQPPVGEREDRFATWAKQAGMTDVTALVAGLRSHEWAAKVDADLAEARDVGARGTPWFFVNGIRIAGAQPYEAFQTAIDQQLIAARAKVASGVAPERLYAVLSKENRAAQPADRDDDEDEPEDTKTVYAVPLGTSPVRGDAAAPVTIVEFADYECPFCSRAEPVLQELRATYGDKLRFVFRNEPLPFHKRAEPAAQAALEVRAAKGDAAFWSMHDALLDGSRRDLGEDALVQLGASFGARPEKMRAAIEKHVHVGDIEADQDAANDFQVSGTPHFFINGRRLVGAQPRDAFAAIIDEELKKAQALVAGGTKPADLYEALTKGGVGPPEPPRADLKPLPAGDPVRGPANARVEIHEFGDFECPFCSRAEPALKQVAAKFGDKVRFVWHDVPLSIHVDAMPAARAAREARKQRGDTAFWALHDRFFAEGAKIERADLDAAARSLHLDMTAWTHALDGDAHAVEVEADAAAAAAIGIKGTPTFVVAPAGGPSGYVVVGAPSFLALRKIILRILAEAPR